MKEPVPAAMDSAPIAFDAKRCVHAFDKYAACEQCVAACPTAALSRNGAIAFHAAACVNCGLCAHLCPLGAFTGNDGVNELLACAARQAETSRTFPHRAEIASDFSLGRVEQIELACARHPAAARGPRESQSVIVTDGCLGALGASAYLALLAQGGARVLARLDACAECPQGKARAGIAQTIATARALGGTVEALSEPAGEEWVTRPLIRVSQPQLSRRDFLRTFAAHGQALAAQALTLVDEPETEEKRPPRERRRLLNVLHKLPPPAEGTVDAPPFARAQVSAACTACGACARACPTGALQLRQNGKTYRLTFAAAHCTACGACVDLCEPQALRLTRGAAPGELLSARSTVAWEGTVRKCLRCGVAFASASEDSRLCPICEFRVQNPFGSRMPGLTGRGGWKAKGGA